MNLLLGAGKVYMEWDGYRLFHFKNSGHDFRPFKLTLYIGPLDARSAAASKYKMYYILMWGWGGVRGCNRMIQGNLIPFINDDFLSLRLVSSEFIFTPQTMFHQPRPHL